MSAIETIHAAIVKLETLQASSTPGPWVHGDRQPATSVISEMFDADATLIVTLHNTIDSQLSILRAAQDDYNRYGGKPSQFFANDVNLARAILGEDH